MLAGGGPLPKGPMGWGASQPSAAAPAPTTAPEEDPLTKTQKSPASPISLTSTQKSEVSSLTSTQRSPSAAFPTVGPAMGKAGPVPADLRRPEMRSPAPRPESSRSLWIPIVVVLVLAVAATLGWMYLEGMGPFG